MTGASLDFITKIDQKKGENSFFDKKIDFKYKKQSKQVKSFDRTLKEQRREL